MNVNNPKGRIENIVVQDFANEVLIYDLKINKAFCLNQTSAMIWNLCDGKHSIADIANSLSQKLNEPITEDLIWLALDRFKKDNLLERGDKFEINFSGLSRRQIIKKIGFASLIALPMVSSIVAPSAAMAGSGLALLSPCASPSVCLSGLCLVPTAAAPGFTSPAGPVCCQRGASHTPGSSISGGICFATPQCNLVGSFRCCTGTATLDPSGCSSGGGCICT